MKTKQLILSLAALYTLPLISLAQPQRSPAGLLSGLFAWYDGTTFNTTTQEWNPRFGSTPLVRYAANGNLSNVTLSPSNTLLNQQQYLVMDGVGLQAEVLPTTANASYTLFAVSQRTNAIKPSPQYVETAWGLGGQSAYPGFVQSPSTGHTHTFRNTTNRSDEFVESHPRGKPFVISSLSFGFGSENLSEPKIASINGEAKVIDPGNSLNFSNGYVYINANAAFPPNYPYQSHNFAEFIIYNRKLSDTERHRVTTYLSLKYALPILTGVPSGTRITIDGTTDLWDSTQGFNKDIVGVGRYDAAGLDVRSGYGINPDLFISTVKDVAVSVNNSFLLIGDKGTHHEMANATNTVDIPGGKRLKRIWRVQNTGFADSVYLRTPSTVPPEGGLSIDACAPVRMLISSDSTFATYKAIKLDIFTPYETSVPPLFSAHTANVKFNEGESYITFASINTAGTPIADQEDSDTQNFDSCADGEGFRYFTDGQGRPILGIKGLTAAQISEYGLDTKIRVLAQPVTSGDNNMMRRLLSITSAPFATGVKATIRFYFTAQEFEETKITNGIDFWFKKTGATGTATITDFSDDGILTPGTFAILNGIRGTQNGTEYVEFRDLESFSTFGFISSESGPLPVRLIQFDGKSENKIPHLYWKTSSEINADYFEIERSVDARKWSTIGRVKAVGGVKSTKEYTYSDLYPTKENAYYRLKLVDLDGSFSLSRIVLISTDSNLEIILYPNPAHKNVVRLKSNSGKLKNIRDVVFLDQRGVNVLRLEKKLTEDLDISHLLPGKYSVVITMDNGESISKKLIINR